MKAKEIMKSLFTAALLITMLSFGANAQKGYKQNRLNHIPDLTEEQENTIKDLGTKYFSDIKNLRADMRIMRAEKDKLMMVDNPDQTKVNNKIDEMSKTRTKIQKKKAAFHLAVRKELTDEQIAAWNSHCIRKGHRDRGNKGCHHDKTHQKHKKHSNK